MKNPVTTSLHIELDPSLELSPKGATPEQHAALVQRASGASEYVKDPANPWSRGEVVPKPVVRVCVPEHAAAYHLNYIEYLDTCWAQHYGVVVAPHTLWNIVLTELAKHIKGNAEHYRSKFTQASEGKIEISIPTGDPELINVHALVNILHAICPTSPDLLLPKLSTATTMSELAHAAAFLDAVSPFYNYSMYLCGLSKVRLDGTPEDWQTMASCLQGLEDVLDLATDYLQEVRERVLGIALNFTAPDPEFWKEMFSLEKCGSGSQYLVRGWIYELFMGSIQFPQTCNFPSQVSKVEYRNLSTEKDYALFHGLFSSQENAGFLVPQFSYIIESR